MSIGRAAAVATPSGLFPLIQQQQRRKIEQYNNLRLTKLEALHLLSQQYQQMASNDRNALVWNSGRDLSYGTGFDNTSSSWPLAQGSPSEALVRSADQVDSQIVVGDPFKEFLVKKVGSGGEPGRRLIFPVPLAHPLDKTVLSSHQAFLREQIELFQATHEDIATPTRGRNKRIILGQVGMRCRHCAHVPVAMRQLGSTYFPSVMIGFYQAAQNMCSMHLQCGKCTSTPASVKQEFVNLLNTKNASSIAGRSYWAKTVGDLGLVDTEEGVFVKGEVPAHIKLIEKDSKNTHFYKSHTKKEQLSLSNKAS